MVKEKILVVEDEAILSEAYELILANEGYEVEVASDGDVALDRVYDFKPDLILLDLRMPKVGGIEFLEELSKNNQPLETKIIVFSNMDSQKDIDQAYELGAKRYILKAWASPKELIQLVKDTLEAN